MYFSFLFFGRRPDFYLILLIGGIGVSLIAFLTILFGKGAGKSKLFWALILLLSVVLLQLAEPLLIRTSFIIYVRANDNHLREINGLLTSHPGTLHIYPDNITTKGMELGDLEIDRLKELRKEVDAYLIIKTDSTIYYGLSGFLDVRHGVSYRFRGKHNPAPHLIHRKLIGNWYY